jgi:two-component system sensor histidine kinase CpxA
VEVGLEKTQKTNSTEAVVKVADCGCGVPADALEKLFQPFYRIDDDRGRLTGGVGLGLAITERAVRFHGGSVSASNRPEGGLLIEIRLPLVPGSAASKVREVAALDTEKAYLVSANPGTPTSPGVVESSR